MSRGRYPALQTGSLSRQLVKVVETMLTVSRGRYPALQTGSLRRQLVTTVETMLTVSRGRYPALQSGSLSRQVANRSIMLDLSITFLLMFRSLEKITCQ